MKAWTLALAPWMVAASVMAQSDAPRPAEVVVTHYGKISTLAWQVGDDCYVPAESAVRWGWKASIGKTDVTLTTEDRTAKVPFRSINGRAAINLGLAARKFGGGAEWMAGTGTFVVFAVVRNVAVRDGVISIDSTLPIKPKLSFLDGPPRMILDFSGAKLDARAKPELSEDSRVGMFEPTTFRVVVETTKRPQIPAHQIRPSRDFEFNFGSAPDVPPNDPGGEQKVGDDGKTGEIQSTINDFGSGGLFVDPNPVPSPIARVTAPAVASSTSKRIVLQFKPTASLYATPQVTRPEPHIVELTMPGALYEGDFEPKVDVESIKSLRVTQGPASTAYVFELVRPHGVQLSQQSGVIQLVLVVPVVGDGKLSSKTVVVDAGHGGHDGGARAPDGSASEKWMTLSISKKLAETLSNEGAAVIMTRVDDVFIPLKERPAIASRSRADFFVSIHINSSAAGRGSTGGMTFFHSKDPLGQLLAECIQGEIAKVSKLKSHGAWSDSRIYDTGFAVLRLSTMPSVLIEMGFINNTNDRKRMLETDFQTKVAEAIVKGLKVYLGDGK